jgi:Na+/H+ antiporter NhaA
MLEPSTFVQGVAVGMFVGTMLGIFLMCLMQFTDDADE